MFWAGIALVFAVIGLRVYYVVCLRGPKIIRKWEQADFILLELWGDHEIKPIPGWVQVDDIRYDENEPYALALVQDGYEFDWPHIRPRYYLVFGLSDDLFGSGIKTGFYTDKRGEDLQSYLDNCQVKWGEGWYHPLFISPPGPRCDWLIVGL